MSIGIYAFLRIYFLSFGLSAFAQFRTRCRSDCPGVAVWYRVQTGAACPASGRVCRALHGLSCIWHGLPCCVCDVQSFRVRWGHPGGIGPEARVGAVSPVTTEKIKKAQNHPTPIVNLKNSTAKTKRPLQRVCVLCYTCLTSLEREESVKWAKIEIWDG